MVNEQAEGGVKLTWLRVYRWSDNLAQSLVPPNEALFIFRITTAKHGQDDEIKHPPLVMEFEIGSLSSLFVLVPAMILETNFFRSFETVLKLAQQVMDYISACFSFHLLVCCNYCCRGGDRCPAFSSRQPRLVFVADVVLYGDHHAHSNPIPFIVSHRARSYLSSVSTAMREFVTSCVDFTECLAADVGNIEEFSDVGNILQPWITERVTGRPISNGPMDTAKNPTSSHKKRNLNEHQQSRQSQCSATTVQKNLSLDLVKVKPTVEIIDQVSECVDDNECAICFRSLSEKTQTGH